MMTITAAELAIKLGITRSEANILLAIKSHAARPTLFDIVEAINYVTTNEEQVATAINVLQSKRLVAVTRSIPVRYQLTESAATAIAEAEQECNEYLSRVQQQEEGAVTGFDLGLSNAHRLTIAVLHDNGVAALVAQIPEGISAEAIIYAAERGIKGIGIDTGKIRAASEL